MADRSHLRLVRKPKSLGDEGSDLIRDFRGVLERLQAHGVWDRANYSQPITEALDRAQAMRPLRLSQEVHEAEAELGMVNDLLRVLFRQFWMSNEERTKWGLPQRAVEPEPTDQDRADWEVFERFTAWKHRVDEEGALWLNDQVVS